MSLEFVGGAFIFIEGFPPGIGLLCSFLFSQCLSSDSLSLVGPIPDVGEDVIENDGRGSWRVWGKMLVGGCLAGYGRVVGG